MINLTKNLKNWSIKVEKLREFDGPQLMTCIPPRIHRFEIDSVYCLQIPKEVIRHLMHNDDVFILLWRIFVLIEYTINL